MDAVPNLSLLFVCLGNICRSPLAEAVMRKKYGKLCGAIESAGTNGYHDGEGADPRMLEKAAEHGVDLSRHVSRRVRPEDFERFDFILAMDESIRADVRSFQKTRGRGASRVELFISGKKVPDPYYGGEEGFERVFELVDDGCDALARRIGIVQG